MQEREKDRNVNKMNDRKTEKETKKKEQKKKSPATPLHPYTPENVTAQNPASLDTAPLQNSHDTIAIQSPVAAADTKKKPNKKFSLLFFPPLHSTTTKTSLAARTSRIRNGSSLVVVVVVAALCTSSLQSCMQNSGALTNSLPLLLGCFKFFLMISSC